MKKYMKQLSIASSCWMLIFVLDYIIELFQIDESGVVTTLTGLRIETHITPDELNSLFSLTWQAVGLYALFVVIWFAVYHMFQIKKAA
ncbi:hypothetical protein [Oenococcus sp.]|uniref:hypothetical protein n=1 Tax=Oenococcus sp. TaxID=1979414 RepID=UPI0039EA9C19